MHVYTPLKVWLVPKDTICILGMAFASVLHEVKDINLLTQTSFKAMGPVMGFEVFWVVGVKRRAPDEPKKCCRAEGREYLPKSDRRSSRRWVSSEEKVASSVCTAVALGRSQFTNHG